MSHKWDHEKKEFVEVLAENVKPISPQVQNLVESLFDLVEKKRILHDAKIVVPHYTGQYSREDYYAAEQEAFNRAAEKFHKALVESLKNN